MVLPFRRRSSEEEPVPKDEDEDLEAVLESVAEPKETVDNPMETDTTNDTDLDLADSALTVVTTCMDIRRNENVLIVCDPTTAEIGAALHEAAMTRSDRVLLMLMPKGRHHGKEPPSPVATLMRQQQVVIAPTKYSLTHTRAVRTARVCVSEYFVGAMTTCCWRIKVATGDGGSLPWCRPLGMSMSKTRSDRVMAAS